MGAVLAVLVLFAGGMVAGAAVSALVADYRWDDPGTWIAGAIFGLAILFAIGAMGIFSDGALPPLGSLTSKVLAGLFFISLLISALAAFDVIPVHNYGKGSSAASQRA